MVINKLIRFNYNQGLRITRMKFQFDKNLKFLRFSNILSKLKIRLASDHETSQNDHLLKIFEDFRNP